MMFKNFQLSFLPTHKACRDFTFVGVHASYEHGDVGIKGCAMPHHVSSRISFLLLPSAALPRAESRRAEAAAELC